MAVLNFREVLPRTFSHRFGEAPQAERKFIATVDVPTETQTVINAIGVFHGSPHPEYPYLLCLNGSFNETDRHHVEATFTYELPSVGKDDLEPNPLARRDVWSFSTGGAQVPALYYFAENQIAPLVNSAGDFFEGLTTTEAEMRVTIAGNRASFDYTLASQVTNCINDSAYLGGGPYTWLCAGISGQQQVEVVNDAEVRYWSFNVELVYRESSHLLLIPDIGFNYIAASASDDSAVSTGMGQDVSDPPYEYQGYWSSGFSSLPQKTPREAPGGSAVKKRAWVIDPESGDKVAAANPVALNLDGSMKPPGSSPTILARRVHRIINFAQYFGLPAF